MRKMQPKVVTHLSTINRAISTCPPHHKTKHSLPFSRTTWRGCRIHWPSGGWSEKSSTRSTRAWGWRWPTTPVSWSAMATSSTPLQLCPNPEWRSNVVVTWGPSLPWYLCYSLHSSPLPDPTAPCILTTAAAAVAGDDRPRCART